MEESHSPLVAVVNVRLTRKCIYVGRACNGFQGHPLANPFKVDRWAPREEREECLRRYCEWLDALPERDTLLAALVAKVRESGLPLGCWCGEWPQYSGLRCHAVELAKRVDALLRSCPS